MKFYHIFPIYRQHDIQTQNGMTSKAQVVLRMSGGRNAEGLVGTAFGVVAGKPLAEGTIVVSDVHFATHEYDGRVYQDVNIFDLMPLKSPQQVGEHF